MRHRKTGVKLNRTSSHRQAMFRNMVTSLFKYDRIRTTDVKAKEVRRWADHIITLAKRGDLHARRQAIAIIREKAVVQKLFDEAGDRFGTINGGYTRIIKIGHRPGDAAPISMIELIGDEDRKKGGKKSKAPDVKKKTKTARKPETTKTADEDQKPEENIAGEDSESKALKTMDEDSGDSAEASESQDAPSKQGDPENQV